MPHPIARTMLPLIACAAIFAAATDAHAKLLSPQQLKGCQMHAIGIYNPGGTFQDDRVSVTVRSTDEPIVLVLCSYFGAQWNVDIADDVSVRQIIVSSYYESSITGVPDDIPIARSSYYRDRKPVDEDYFWAFAWHSQRGRDMRERLQKQTGLELATFQGDYSAKQFVVDGKRGDVKKYASQASTSASGGDSQQAERPNDTTAPRTRVNETQQQMRAIGDLMESVNRSIDSLISPDDAGADSVIDESSKAVISKLVRRAFELETELQQTRLEQAEARLQLVKQQLAERRRAADQIIAERIDRLLGDGEVAEADQSKTQIAKAEALSAQGRAAFNARDLKVAQKRFEAALKIDPQNTNAMNGLGWTLNNRGEFQRAIDQFRKLLQREPDHAAALNGVGQSLLALGRLDEAEAVLLEATETLIKQHGEERTVKLGLTASWHGLVRTYLRQKEFAQAKQWATRLLKHDNNNNSFQSLLDEAEEGLSQEGE